jgi:NitT/TauT family transport system ATP-binding protein
VRVGGQTVEGITSGVSYMFQADSLFPWKTVLANVMTGPLLTGTPKRQATDLARDWLRRVGLNGFEDRYPHQLSGGMRKRVAMAAALINNPRILLMDEPFGALDVQTKVIMQAELLQLWEQLRPSVLFITHDLDEAVALSDRVAVMTSSPGSIKDVFDIDLPRPRGNIQDLRHETRFLELQGRIWESLRDEVTRAYTRSVSAA